MAGTVFHSKNWGNIRVLVSVTQIPSQKMYFIIILLPLLSILYTCVYKISDIGFEHHGRRNPREVTDMAGSRRSTDSAAKHWRVEQNTD